MQSDGSRTQLLEGPPPGARVSHVIARLHRASCIGEQVDLLYGVQVAKIEAIVKKETRDSFLVTALMYRFFALS
jgi:hypothetical protein